MLLLEATSASAHVHHGERRVVVDEDLRFTQTVESLHRVVPLSIGQVAIAKLGGIEASVGRQNALRQFQGAHFEREEQCRFL